MDISKTSRLSLVEQVVSQIESLIQSDTWPVGTRIPPELDLMKQFDVSRNTLREAIRALVHAGLLQTKQGSGTFVCSSSILGAAFYRRIKKADLLETLEVRHALEREAAQLAAIRRSEEDVEKLLNCLGSCQAAVQNKDRQQYAEADIQLHKAIVQAAHNSILSDLYEHMTEALQISVQNLVDLTTDAGFHEDIHSQLVTSIIDKRADQAMDAVNHYISEFKETLHMEE
ncbi:FadR/GntR family transcriptional regulator [Bacillus atrophaeus]|uniref:FadR/GntR family transcriptional regulator n=1 Tax=Bacillus atrophaeus TaxID=1452 RepID=UPI0007C441B3|nr:FadR/GntR family transcriptional regulator [Bacillus atrophaeus]MBU5265043.1 FadR family transcriptional regulator [Bacillus atrophaeus]MCY8522677.1 FadR family transcriptional regulator [Bacillus atrophaeus]MCY8527165.1 FadR family transcriptional regulator [Bacillus atrophaeus]QUF65973.1 FadR family transcriptional regulator [Bacillus atrophaeus]WFE14784.1 FadR/GntR family transcriptional regulator [Bacillus atrophaeus]